MKTEKALNQDILNVTMQIDETYPELSKYISELQVKISDNTCLYPISEDLEDYFDSLEDLLKSYALFHITVPVSLSRKSILIIEDNAEILQNLTEFLEKEGYNILTATRGKRGVELARKFIPDLIICDVLMPEMDGYEVLYLLLETTITSGIPFIFSTSNSEPIDKMKALKLGADGYIIKPFELSVLMKMITTLIKSGKVPVRI